MHRNYFFFGSLIGLVVAFFLAWFILGANFFDLFAIQADQKYFGFPPILLGMLTIVFLSIWVDRKNVKMNYLKSALIFPAAIFFVGVLIGSLANWAINGGFENAFDYIVKPMFWILRVGFPASIMIGSLYFLLRRHLILISTR